MKLSPKPRQNAIQFLSYIHSILDLEHMTKEEGPDSIKVYQSAMEFLEKTLGNKDYVLLEPHDIDFMLSVREQSKKIEEIALETSTSVPKTRSIVTKLLAKGLVTGFSSRLDGKKTMLYKITPYGMKRLREETEDQTE